MEILQVTLLILLINAVTFLQCCLLVRGKPAVCRRKPPIISTLPGNGNPLVVVTAQGTLNLMARWRIMREAGCAVTGKARRRQAADLNDNPHCGT